VAKITRSALAALARLFLLASMAASAAAHAQSGPRDEERAQLRALLAEIEAAISSLDIERFLKSLEPEATITWQNAEVSRGSAAIRAYHERMVGASGPVVKKFSTKATLGAPAVFYGPDVAVAYGKNVDHYDLAGGLAFDLNANWSATAHKRDGQWKVAALHFSTNLFDNALLNRAQRSNWYFAAGGFVLALILMWVIARLRRRKAS
jgi:uncharacterized protein (TIGR02246 family)